MLYDKWWKSPGDTCMRTEKGKESKANSLGVDNIGNFWKNFIYNGRKKYRRGIIIASTNAWYFWLWFISIFKNIMYDMCIMSFVSE